MKSIENALISDKAPIPAYNAFETPTSAYASRKRSTAFNWARNSRILNNVTEAIGLTPLVKLNRILKENGVDPSITVLAKLEFFNPGGSIKDRIAESMFSVVPKTEETVVIEASSGNTACGLALNSAVHNVRSVFTIPNTCSLEKESILKAFGSQVVRSEGNQPWYDGRSYLGVARRAETAVRNAGDDPSYLDQYQHPRNPRAHYTGTAEEIYEQTSGNLDFVVIGAGTGGTLSGVGTRLKQLLQSCKVIGVQPEGSILHWKYAESPSTQPRSLFEPDDESQLLERSAVSWKVEGIGKKYRPPNLTSGVVDSWIQVSDTISFETARQIIRCEGILAGGSSGTALAACLRLAKMPENKGKTFVVIFPDGARNYISTFLDDGWLGLNGCGSVEHAASYSFWLKMYGDSCVEAVLSRANCNQYVSLVKESTVSEAIEKMRVEKVRHCLVFKNPKMLEVLTVCSIEDLRNIGGSTLLENVNINKYISCKIGFPIANLMTLFDEMTRVWNLRNPGMVFYEQAERSTPRSPIRWNLHLLHAELINEIKVSDLRSSTA